MKKTWYTFLVIAGLFSVTSCYRYPSDTDLLSEKDVVLTLYDVNTNFNNYHTFSIVDSIGIIKDDDTVVKRISNDTTTAVLNEITQNMVQHGFLQVNKDSTPDLAINVVAIRTLNVVGEFYPGYWWGYPGYFPPDYWYPTYWDWWYYYPWYPVYYYTYQTGTLVIDIVDLKNPEPTTQKLKIVFNTYIRGILAGTHTIGQILTDIDQAFKQTPQLATTAN